MTVPKKARGRSGALLAVGGVDLAGSVGYEEDECVLFGEGCDESSASSLNGLIKSLTSAPKNNALQAQLVLEDEEAEDATAAVTKTVHRNLTVTGEAYLPVTVRR